MVLIHAAAAAGMIKVKCARCGEAQVKLRSKSGRYVCTRCHHAFVAERGPSPEPARTRKTSGRR